MGLGLGLGLGLGGSGTGLGCGESGGEGTGLGTGELPSTVPETALINLLEGVREPSPEASWQLAPLSLYLLLPPMGPM